MSTEDKSLDEFRAWAETVEWWDFNHDGRATNRKSARAMAYQAWQASRRTYRVSEEKCGPENAVSEGVSTPLRPVEGVDHLSVRRAALEEAAKACEEVREDGDTFKKYEDNHDDGHMDGCNNCAAAIRALAAKTQEG